MYLNVLFTHTHSYIKTRICVCKIQQHVCTVPPFPLVLKTSGVATSVVTPDVLLPFLREELPWLNLSTSRSAKSGIGKSKRMRWKLREDGERGAGARRKKAGEARKYKEAAKLNDPAVWLKDGRVTPVEWHTCVRCRDTGTATCQTLMRNVYIQDSCTLCCAVFMCSVTQVLSAACSHGVWHARPVISVHTGRSNLRSAEHPLPRSLSSWGEHWHSCQYISQTHTHAHIGVVCLIIQRSYSVTSSQSQSAVA